MIGRIEARGQAAAEAAAARIAETCAAVPGVAVRREAGAVLVEARGLARRRVEEAALRVPWLA